MREVIQFYEIENEESFNPLLIYPKVPFTQAYFYGEWQKSVDRKVRRFVVKNGHQLIACFQVIKYPLPFGKSYLYIPYGPVIKNPLNEEILEALKREMIKLLREEKAIFIRLDFTPPLKNKADLNLLKKFFHQASLYTYQSAYFQPRAEWFLYLEKSPEDLLKAMHPKTRYNIRLAKRKGVQVDIIKKDLLKYFDLFYALSKETSLRDNFNLYPKSYYQSVFKTSEKYGNAFLAIARYNQKILVINFILLFGDIANFVFGASSSEYRNLMPSHLAHWEAILQAKQLGYGNYNFGAVAKNKVYKGWKGLSIFKKKFGGSAFEHSDFYDLVAQPFWYRLYNLGKFIKKL